MDPIWSYQNVIPSLHGYSRRAEMAPETRESSVVETSENTGSGMDPWQGAPPGCRVFPEARWFVKVLRDFLGDAVRLIDTPDTGEREAILVDCTESGDAIRAARQRYPSRPLVGVLPQTDTARIIDALATGADGVIALTDPPHLWRECLHVVLGGGRWLGGPGLEVSLQHKDASYDIAKNEQHPGDVTVRTRMFVKGRVGDKVRS